MSNFINLWDHSTMELAEITRQMDTIHHRHRGKGGYTEFDEQLLKELRARCKVIGDRRYQLVDMGRRIDKHLKGRLCRMEILDSLTGTPATTQTTKSRQGWSPGTLINHVQLSGRTRL